MFLGSSVFFAITDAVAAARRERDIAEDFTVKSPATPEWVRMACADRFTEMVGVVVYFPRRGFFFSSFSYLLGKRVI